MSYVVMGSGTYIAHKPEDGEWDTDQVLVGTSGYRPRVMKHTDGTYLYAYHRNLNGYNVFIRTSTDRVNWSDPVQLTTNGNSHDPFPNQMTDGAYMVYYAKAEGVYNLWRKRSYDTVNWEPEEQITSDNTNNTQPHFFVEDGQIYLVWAHAVSYPNDHDVYFETTEYYTDIQEQESSVIPSDISLDVFPNPFNPITQITFSIPKQEHVNLKIYNVQGHLIKNLIDAEKEAGYYTIMWDGKNDDGRSVSSGVYLYKVEAGRYNSTKQMILLK